MKIKKVLSVLLTLALVLSILPELGFTKDDLILSV